MRPIREAIREAIGETIRAAIREAIREVIGDVHSSSGTHREHVVGERQLGFERRFGIEEWRVDGK